MKEISSCGSETFTTEKAKSEEVDLSEMRSRQRSRVRRDGSLVSM